MWFDPIDFDAIPRIQNPIFYDPIPADDFQDQNDFMLQNPQDYGIDEFESEDEVEPELEWEETIEDAEIASAVAEAPEIVGALLPGICRDGLDNAVRFFRSYLGNPVFRQDVDGMSRTLEMNLVITMNAARRILDIPEQTAVVQMASRENIEAWLNQNACIQEDGVHYDGRLFSLEDVLQVSGLTMQQWIQEWLPAFVLFAAPSDLLDPWGANQISSRYPEILLDDEFCEHLRSRICVIANRWSEDVHRRNLNLWMDRVSAHLGFSVYPQTMNLLLPARPNWAIRQTEAIANTYPNYPMNIGLEIVVDEEEEVNQFWMRRLSWLWREAGGWNNSD